MKNTTRKNSMRKVSAVLAMAMAMSAAVSTMAVTASAHQYEACTCNCADTCECNCADNCTCDDTCDCICEKTCDCEDHAEMGQPVPFTFRVEGRNGRVSDFHFKVSYKSAPLCPDSDLAKQLIQQLPGDKNAAVGPVIDGKLTCYGSFEVTATSDGVYEYTIPGWADPSTIEIKAGYNGLGESSNHNNMINFKFSNYSGKVGSIRLSTSSSTKWWGGYSTAMNLDVNNIRVARGEG